MRIRFLKSVTSFFLFFILAPNASALDVSAECAILYDPVAQRALFEKEPDRQMPIASTTKIMTALVVLEHADMDELVTIGPEPPKVEGSSMYLKEGEQVTVGDLLYGLMLVSGNDAATALALHVGGSIEGFASMMNETAKKIGLEHSSFTNPHGLDHELHYSTARDMARLTARAMENPDFEAIVSTKDMSIPPRHLRNHNKLLWRLDGSDGVKTGYTKHSGRCLVSSASREGQRLIAVTLNAPDDWSDHSAMINCGFKDYPARKLLTRGEHIADIPVLSGMNSRVGVNAPEPITLALSDGEFSRLEISRELPSFVYAPVRAGGSAGTISYSLDGRTLARAELEYDETVPELKPREPGFWDFLGG